jgi:conjugative transfer signal peptidase TraF
MASLRGVDWSGALPPESTEDPPLERPRRRRARLRAAMNPGRTALGLLLVCALTTALACLTASQIIWNRTASLPLGFYLRTPAVRVGEGMLVALPIPPSVRSLVHDRRYLRDGSLLVKPVAAVAGDHVCARRGILFINGEPFGSILPRDSENRELPVYQGCGVLPDGQVFLASHHPRSFDSRSFGPVDVHALQGTVTPLWTF